MGTSSSSAGPGAGVPLVPPWVPDLPVPDEDGSDCDPADTGEEAPRAAEVPLAPQGRFGPARRSLGRFGKDGDLSALERGLGHYVRRGYGGAGTATRRLGGTVQTAALLYGALSSPVGGAQAEASNEVDLLDLNEKSADEIMDALVEAVRPTDGTLDSESARGAIRDALSDLLSRFANADLSALTEEQRIYAVERYVALDVFGLFRLDVGKALQEKAPSDREALSRFNDVKDYLTEAVSARFRILAGMGRRMTGSNIANLTREALQQTFQVFEEYV